MDFIDILRFADPDRDAAELYTSDLHPRLTVGTREIVDCLPGPTTEFDFQL